MTAENHPSRDGSTERRATFAVFIVAFATLIGTLMQSAVIPLLPIFPAELGASSSDVSWLVTALLLSGVISCAIFGRLADIFGKRRMLLFCLGGLLVGSVIGALATTLPVLIVGRVLQGFGMALLPIGIGLLRDIVSGERLVGGIAFVSSLSGIGGTLGAVCGGLIAQFLPWEWLFIGTAILTALAIVGVLLILPATPGNGERQIDVAGAVILTLALTAILMAISDGNTWGWGSPLTLGLLGAGIVVLFLWVLFELRREHPLINLRMLARRPVLLTYLVTMLLGFGMYGIILASPQLAQIPTSTGYGLGATALVAGLLTLPSAIFAILAPRFAARLIRAKGPRTSIAMGALVLVGGYALLLVWHSSIWALVIANVFVAVGLAFAYSATPTLLLSNVDRSQSAEATGVNTVFRTFGTSISAAVVSALLTGIHLGDATTPAEGAFVLVFAVTGVSCLAVLPVLAMITRGRAARGAR